MESPDSKPGIRFNLADWLLALLQIAMRLHPDREPQQAFDMLVEENVLQSKPVSPFRREDKLAEVMLRNDVIDMLEDARDVLHPIFLFYVNQQEVWKEFCSVYFCPAVC